MSLGTAPQRLVRLLETDWTASRVGRGDVPTIIQQATGGDDPRLNSGVLVLRDRENVAVDLAKHDVIHIYHPEAAPPVEEDNGYREKRVVETVQIDIELTDRNATDADPQANGTRLGANERMTGDRDGLSDTDSAPYGGVWGEVRYILETYRRGLDEWDKVSQDPVNIYLGNSNADVSINVELEQIATNTV